ncbi:cytochrome P450 [Stereum hirsutum FP-91666 SS1]|uniref:cytochrome P450 n=1 Tax=Stereum hirsutum (strain FP-91666) TaxID=721885 RepID=UPI000440C983|nr:cytochrome P450 [Stereum hirsutum FP-91666 SS1]EIM87138.1 cytochrome P450 [Stereum hirsutum FP-91666 SS1]
MECLASPSVILSVSVLSVLLVRVAVGTKQPKDVQTLSSPSAKEASWIWGHERTLFLHQACEKYVDWMRELGSVYKIKAALFGQDVIVIADNAAAQHIFQYTDRYTKAPAFRPIIVKLLGKSLVWAEGDEHKKQRRLLAPAFTPESVRGMSDDILESAQKLENRLMNKLESEKGDMTINICPQVSACTLDIIGRVAFGHDFQSGQSPEAKLITDSWNKDVNMGISYAGFLAPFVIGMFPFIASSIGEGVTKGVVSRLADVILEREEKEGGGKEEVNGHGVNGGRSGKDILSLLMQAKRRNNGQGLSNRQIADNVATFIMVGHETSAASLTLTLLDLARDQNSQTKLRNAIARLGDGELDFDAVQKLEYLDAVVREGLRLHPAAPRTDRVALEDDVIPLNMPVHTSDGRIVNTIPVKAGQIFQIPFAALNVNPAVWGPDSQTFKPERWIEEGGVKPASELPHGWGNITTFCDGPRSCIGYRLAVAELKVILATLIRSFEVYDTGAKVRTAISPTLQPVTEGKGGYLPLRLKAVKY